jgi:hypothetical protein
MDLHLDGWIWILGGGAGGEWWLVREKAEKRFLFFFYVRTPTLTRDMTLTLKNCVNLNSQDSFYG